MKLYESFKKMPFYLNDEDIAWVDSTLKGLSLEDKVGQLFCMVVRSGSEQEIVEQNKLFKPGGIMYRPLSVEEAVNYTNYLKKHSDIPMLIAANLEKGGSGIVHEGVTLGSQLEVAATDDVTMAEKLGELCGAQGAAVGANWAFAPILDIDENWRNPITNVRTFGSDPKRVADMSEAYVKAVQAKGLAASIKHFPGDGIDERDHHLVVSVNTTSVEEWDNTSGMAYKRCIDAGAMTAMIGHIMHPAYSKLLNPNLADGDILPASLSHELINGLLREKLGFNGLITTDATPMIGFATLMERSKAVPYSIQAGNDMFLFTKNAKEDYEFMLEGVANGILTRKRLDEAVARILALKAALKLHKVKKDITIESALAVLKDPKYVEWSKECADKSVTLVKEEKGVLPLSPYDKKRILFYPLEPEKGPMVFGPTAGICDKFKKLLEAEGFEVSNFVPDNMFEGKVTPLQQVKDSYDVIIYLANLSTKSNQTVVRIEWAQPMGANCPQYISSIPTIFISVENPYHLIDVPRIKTFINAYNSNDNVLQAIVDKLVGRSEFKGTSPVDAFCGKWDTRL